MENEISTLIANQMGVSTDEDLAALNMELDELMGTTADVKPAAKTGSNKTISNSLELPEAPTSIILPAAPVGDINLGVPQNVSSDVGTEETHTESNQRELIAS